MSSFYRYWMQGETKQQAFKHAVNDVRKDYPEPFYWAPLYYSMPQNNKQQKIYTHDTNIPFQKMAVDSAFLKQFHVASCTVSIRIH